MLCLNFILAFCISCGLARPHIQPPAQTQNEDEPEPVVSMASRSAAWLPLPIFTNHGFSKLNFHFPPNSLQYYNFPRNYASSSFNTQKQYRMLLTNLSIEEPRDFFTPEDKTKKSNTSGDLTIPLRVNIDTTKEMLHTPEAAKPPSLAPFRAHPLFHFIHNINTLPPERVIRFRTSNSVREDEVATLILKPQATAVAGVEGKAISNPLSRAILRKGTNADILFEPAAVAIAGPGGIAHAQSDLEISYEDT